MAIAAIPVAYAVLVMSQLLLAWLAYVAGSEFGGLKPETLVAIAMVAYTLFPAAPRLTSSIVWMPGFVR